MQHKLYQLTDTSKRQLCSPTHLCISTCQKQKQMAVTVQDSKMARRTCTINAFLQHSPTCSCFKFYFQPQRWNLKDITPSWTGTPLTSYFLQYFIVNSQCMLEIKKLKRRQSKTNYIQTSWKTTYTVVSNWQAMCVCIWKKAGEREVSCKSSKCPKHKSKAIVTVKHGVLRFKWRLLLCLMLYS